MPSHCLRSTNSESTARTAGFGSRTGDGIAGSFPAVLDRNSSLCRARRPLSRVAYVIVYDLHEKGSRLTKRNKQFHRIFGQLRQHSGGIDLLLLVPSLDPELISVVTSGLDTEHGVKVMLARWPFVEAELSPPLRLALRTNPNCCGWREFYKLAVWGLTMYDRVMLLDSDLQILSNVINMIKFLHSHPASMRAENVN